MVVFPNCKINLGLHIKGKRGDGFHDLETIFYPVPLTDALEIIASPNNETTCITTGISIDVQSDNNICTKAYYLLKKYFAQLPAVQIHLHKAIPSGAGLGGGSSNGACTLQLLNKKWSLGLTQQQLLNYAAQLGSDCPFFILNTPTFATGRGEILEGFSLDLSAYKLVIINPGIHVNTGWAFSQLTISSLTVSLKNMVQQDPNTWKGHLLNDFEEPVFTEYPEIGSIKKTLYEEGAIYASMSGTGSTVYGLFSKNAPLNLSFPDHYFVREF